MFFASSVDVLSYRLKCANQQKKSILDKLYNKIVRFQLKHSNGLPKQHVRHFIRQ
jgi:hypothetical protein